MCIGALYTSTYISYYTPVACLVIQIHADDRDIIHWRKIVIFVFVALVTDRKMHECEYISWFDGLYDDEHIKSVPRTVGSRSGKKKGKNKFKSQIPTSWFISALKICERRKKWRRKSAEPCLISLSYVWMVMMAMEICSHFKLTYRNKKKGYDRFANQFIQLMMATILIK